MTSSRSACNMNHIRSAAVLALCFLWLSALNPTAAQVKHFGLTATDAFRSCAAKVFGKPVVINQGLVSIDSACHPGDTSTSLRSELTSRGELVADGPTFIYLTPLGEFKQYFGSEDRQVLIEWVPQAGPNPLPECVSLSQEDLSTVGQVVLREARMPFWSAGNQFVGSKDGTIRDKLRLEIYNCQLKPGTESVFGMLGGTRLIYGEMRNHQFTLLWDSPALANYGHIIDLKDVNGDGTREMLVGWEQGGGQNFQGLAIFAPDGTELDPGDDAFLGESFQYQNRSDGKVDVLVVNEKHIEKYTLVNGRYTLAKNRSR